MNEYHLVTTLQDFIPKSVDDIVRVNRDECRCVAYGAAKNFAEVHIGKNRLKIFSAAHRL